MPNTREEAEDAAWVNAFVDRWLARAAAGWHFSRVRGHCDGCGRDNALLFQRGELRRCGPCVSKEVTADA